MKRKSRRIEPGAVANSKSVSRNWFIERRETAIIPGLPGALFHRRTKFVRHATNFKQSLITRLGGLGVSPFAKADNFSGTRSLRVTYRPQHEPNGPVFTRQCKIIRVFRKKTKLLRFRVFGLKDFELSRIIQVCVQRLSLIFERYMFKMSQFCKKRKIVQQ